MCRTGGIQDAVGAAVYANPDDPNHVANLIVNFDNNPFKATDTNYSVLKTNYTDYTVVYTCKQELQEQEQTGAYIEYMWILTRERVPSQDMVKEIMDELAKNGFNNDHFEIIKQTDCPDPPQ